MGPSTAAAVLAYKKARNIINRSYQTQADNIVGKMTIAALDKGMLDVRLVPASPQLRYRIAIACRCAAASPARPDGRGLFASPRVGLISSFLIPVTPGNSTTFDMGTLSISAKPEMPTLSPLAVQIQGINPDPTPNTFFDWSVGITFDETSCTCGKKGVTFSDGFVAPNVLGGTFSFPWPWIRGGDLTIAARATVRGLLLEAIFTGTITGTDPATNDIRTELGDITMRRIANVESGFHQFEADPGTGRIVPKFNFKLDAQGRKGRGDGGAGICQITPPSAAEIWDWKANVKKGKQIFAARVGQP